MKTKGYMGVIIIFAAFIIVAFLAVPAARMMGIELPFIKEIHPDGILELTADLSAYGEFFEIGKDIEVYTDPELTDRLRMIKCVPNEPYAGRYEYSFELPAGTDAIWITTPLLYIPNEIEAVSCGAAAGSTAKRPDGEIWFTVDECRAAKAADGLYTVSILIDPAAKDLPKTPKLIAGGQELGGTAALNFDGKGIFTSGEFRFSVKANNEDEAVGIAEDSTIIIREELTAREVDDLRITRTRSTTGMKGFELNIVYPHPEWVFLDDEYYSVVKKTSEGFIAFEYIQKKEELQIEEQLLDSGKRADTELADQIKNMPDASGLDNMSEDGRFYIDDWDLHYSAMLNDAANVYRIDRDGTSHKLEKSYRPVKFMNSECQLAFVKDDVCTLVLPPNLDYAGMEYHLIENGETSLFPMVDGIYRISESAREAVNMNPEYGSLTYSDAVEKFHDDIFWNHRVVVSPDERHIAFCSNKDDGGQCKLFLIDMLGNEKIIARSEGHDLNVCGWADNEHVAFIETPDVGNAFYTASISGEVNRIDFPAESGEQYFYLGSSNGRLAFSDAAEPDTVLLYNIYEDAAIKTAELVIPGDIRIREGIDIFDPTGTMLAVVFCKDDNARGMAVFNAEDGEMICEKYAPEGDPAVNIILETDWVGDTQLLVAVKNLSTKEISSWLYDLEGM